eukprot:COSAG01_NODE_1463_length_10232_cov_5.501234_10_plen_182_part_00
MHYRSIGAMKMWQRPSSIVSAKLWEHSHHCSTRGTRLTLRAQWMALSKGAPWAPFCTACLAFATSLHCRSGTPVFSSSSSPTTPTWWDRLTLSLLLCPSGRRVCRPAMAKITWRNLLYGHRQQLAQPTLALLHLLPKVFLFSPPAVASPASGTLLAPTTSASAFMTARQPRQSALWMKSSV